MKEQIQLSGIGTCLPSKRMEISDFRTLWSKEGIESELQEKGVTLMKELGRDTQYFFDPERDNYYQMGIEATQEALRNAGVQRDEIDAIVFLSDTPEHTYPTNVILLMEKLKGFRRDVYSFDMNSNCTGMLTAIDVMSRMMKSHPTFKHVLLVSVVVASTIVSNKDVFSKGLFSDGASAVVLSKVVVDEEVGFIDGVFRTKPENASDFRYPAIGMSQIHQEKTIPLEKTKLQFKPGDVSFFSEMWSEMTFEVLERNGLVVSDLACCFFSQFAKPQGDETMMRIGLPLEKTLYIGGTYGYTGINSPIFALKEAKQTGLIEKGDLVLLASVGAGINMSAILIRL